MMDDTERLSLLQVGGKLHEEVHRAEHGRLYAPLLQLAFGDVGTWDRKDALIAFAGRGREAEFFTPYCRSITLTDGYEPCVEMLRRRYAIADRPYIRVLQGNGREFNGVPDSSVDMLTALVALMHIRPLDIRESYAREIQRVLRPGGRALIQVAHAKNSDMSWTETLDGAEYTVNSDVPNVGFTTDEDACRWWARYLAIEYMLRTPTYPGDGTMNNWWWIVAWKRS